MSRLDDGREVLCSLAVPLPLTLAAAVMTAVGEAAEEQGYTDVCLLADGTERIVARKPVFQPTRREGTA